MYHELAEFIAHIGRDRSVWKDGELWTALAVGLSAGIWFEYDRDAVSRIHAHFPDILSVTSIIFGFVMTTLVFYIQTASSWSRDPRVRRVAEKIIDWHVWTIVCMLALIGFIVILWSGPPFLPKGQHAQAIQYGVLVLWTAYCGFQIINHALTVRWAFRRAADLDGKSNEPTNAKDATQVTTKPQGEQTADVINKTPPPDLSSETVTNLAAAVLKITPNSDQDYALPSQRIPRLSSPPPPVS